MMHYLTFISKLIMMQIAMESDSASPL